MTSAVYDDPEAGATVLHFALAMRGAAVKTLDTWRVMGRRGTGSHDVERTDVFMADASRGVLKTVELAMEAAGGAAFYRAAALERLFRDAQAARYHPLREGVQRVVAGKVALAHDVGTA